MVSYIIFAFIVFSIILGIQLGLGWIVAWLLHWLDSGIGMETGLVVGVLVTATTLHFISRMLMNMSKDEKEERLLDLLAKTRSWNSHTSGPLPPASETPEKKPRTSRRNTRRDVDEY